MVFKLLFIRTVRNTFYAGAQHKHTQSFSLSLSISSICSYHETKVSQTILLFVTNPMLYSSLFSLKKIFFQPAKPISLASNLQQTLKNILLKIKIQAYLHGYKFFCHMNPPSLFSFICRISFTSPQSLATCIHIQTLRYTHTYICMQTHTMLFNYFCMGILFYLEFPFFSSKLS